MLERILQDGTALGAADAPVTSSITRISSACMRSGRGALPRSWRTTCARASFESSFEGLPSSGRTPEAALRTALAAGRQDQLWQAVELLYANQGAENSGWVTEDLIAQLTASVPGLHL